MWLDKVAPSIERVFNRISEVTNAVGISILTIMMFVIVGEVIMRGVFNRPFTGTVEIVEFMMVVVVFGAIAYTAVKKGHISIDVVVSRFSPRTQAIIESIVTFVSLGLGVVISWHTVLRGISQWRAGQETVITQLPIHPFIWVAAFGFGLFSLVLMVKLVKSLNRALSGSYWPAWLGLLLGFAVILLISAYALWGKALPWEISRGVVGVLGIAALFVLLFTGMPVAFVMIFVGFLGYAYVVNPTAALGLLGTAPFAFTARYSFSVIPLFMLMGALAFHAGLTRELYRTAYKWIGHFPGGLAMATIGGCAGFASITGSTVATTASMGMVALPEMKKYNYDPSLATASIAAGGSLGPLIPPSGLLIIYAIIAELSVGKVLLAGFLPGVLLAFLFMIAIYVRVRLNPKLGPPGEKTSLVDKIVSLKSTWSVLSLFLLVIGGIYFGLFTPTEGAAVGAFGALVITFAKKKFTRKTFIASILEAGKTTAMVMFILIAATIFSRFLTVTQIPAGVAAFIGGLTISPIAVFALIILVYLVLGCFISSLPMIIITVPIFLPVIIELGFNPIWFGVIGVLVAEMALITPPVGMNVFVITAVAKNVPMDVTMYTVFRGIWPFLLAEIALVFILVAFPQIALFLPGMM